MNTEEKFFKDRGLNTKMKYDSGNVMRIMKAYKEQFIKSQQPDPSPIATQSSLEFKAALTLLRNLADIQNGAPLVQDEKEWKEIMDSTYDFLEQHEYKCSACSDTGRVEGDHFDDLQPCRNCNG